MACFLGRGETCSSSLPSLLLLQHWVAVGWGWGCPLRTRRRAPGSKERLWPLPGTRHSAAKALGLTARSPLPTLPGPFACAPRSGPRTVAGETPPGNLPGYPETGPCLGVGQSVASSLTRLDLIHHYWRLHRWKGRFSLSVQLASQSF